MNQFIDAINAKIEAMKELNQRVPEVVAEILKENEEVIISLNTDDQMASKGLRSDGTNIVTKKGRPWLRKTGSFHKSFKVKKSSTSVEIYATDPKADLLTKRFGEAIFGLTEANKTKVQIEIVKPEIIKKINSL